MEHTHHDEHTCAKILELMSDKLEADDIAQIRASPVLSFGADESVDRGMHENCIVYISWMYNCESLVKFFKFIHLVGETGSENIKNALERALLLADPNYKITCGCVV